MGVTAGNGARVTRSPRGRTALPWPPDQGRGRPQGRTVQGRDHPVSVTERKGVGRSDDDISATASHDGSRHAGLARRIGDRATRPASRTAGRVVLMSQGCDAGRSRSSRHRVLGKRGGDQVRGGPHTASRLALKKAAGVLDLDLIASNEASRLRPARSKRGSVGYREVKVNGGAIAIGHPIGDSGGRIIATCSSK